MSNYEQDRGITRNSEQRHDQEIKRSSKIKRAGCDDQKCREEVATTYKWSRMRGTEYRFMRRSRGAQLSSHNFCQFCEFCGKRREERSGKRDDDWML